ncbi:hypothetical protein WDW89_21225 [Deltaproteobacteria bacterium TL4]
MGKGSSLQDAPPYEAILLSQVITEKKQIRITLMDGDVLIDLVKWHTPNAIGLKDGKIVNKQVIKYWELLK